MVSSLEHAPTYRDQVVYTAQNSPQNFSFLVALAEEIEEQVEYLRLN